MNDTNNNSPQSATNGKVEHTQTDATGATTTTTVERTETVPGFFGRIARALRDNPLTTAVVSSAGTGLAVAGGMNYRRYGAVLPATVTVTDIQDVAGATLRAFAPR